MAYACQPVNDLGKWVRENPNARFDAATGGNSEPVGQRAWPTELPSPIEQARAVPRWSLRMAPTRGARRPSGFLLDVVLALRASAARSLVFSPAVTP